MTELWDYVKFNYVWILGIVIVILLAIIGYFADKTNFGHLTTNDKKKDDKKESEELHEVELKEELKVEPDKDIKTKKEEKKADKLEKGEKQKIEKHPEEKKVSKESKEDEELIKFNKAFDEALPARDIMSDDLLSDIENMSLDKTQKIKLSDIPDLDDVDLPKIRKLKTYDEDIWKK